MATVCIKLHCGYLTVIADLSQSTDLQMTIILIAAALKLIISECLICQRACLLFSVNFVALSVWSF